MLTLLLGAMLALPSHAATKTAPERLKAVDDAAAALRDAEFVGALETAKPGAPPRTARISFRRKGAKTVFVYGAPDDMKGLGVLVDGADAAFVYLPAFGRLRRVDPGSRGKPFLGTAFDLDALSFQPYSPAWTATAARADGDLTRLDLSARSGPARTLELWVDSSDRVVRLRASSPEEGVSTLVLSGFRADLGLSDDLFTKRSLTPETAR